MLFLAFSNVDVEFIEQPRKYTWRRYTAIETLPPTYWEELIDKRKFAKVMIDKDSKSFLIHMSAIEIPMLWIYPFRVVHIPILQWDKASTKMSAKYFNNADVFSLDMAMELPENTGIKHAIELVEGKQLLYDPIYSPSSLKLETFKAYIKTHLNTGFIWPSKSPADALILFYKKPDDNLSLCVNC